MEQFEVDIYALDSNGRGVGKTPAGKTIFVEGAIADERCLVEVFSESKSFSEGKAIQILTASSKRQKPACPYYEDCGGCNLMCMSYEDSLLFKRQKVLDCLVRVGRIPQDDIEGKLKDTLGSEKQFNYRNHMQYAIDGLKVGLYKPGSKEVIAINECMLEAKAVGSIRREFERTLQAYPTRLFSGLIVRGSERTGEYLVELVSDDKREHELVIRDAKAYVKASRLLEVLQNAVSYEKAENLVVGIVLQMCADRTQRRTRAGKRITLEGQDFYTEMLLEKTFKVKAGAFFQVNTKQAEALYLTAKPYLEACDVVYDLYCGTGTIGLTLTKDNQSLYGIESNSEAVASAKENANSFGKTNAKFVCKQVEKCVFDGKAFPNPDAVIVDPPRKGMDQGFIHKLLTLLPERIVYISCDPATMARDVKLLMPSYKVEEITPVDMFAWTSHVETVCLLSKLHEAKHHVRVKLDMDEMDITSAESKATYEEIKKYVAEHNDGMKASSLNIAQVKAKYGIIERENYNKTKSEEARQPVCPKDKEEAIVEALKAFRMI